MARRLSGLVPLSFVVVPLFAVACGAFGEDDGGGTPPPGSNPAPDSGPGPIPGEPGRGLEVAVGDPKVTAFVMQGGSLALPVKLTRKESSIGKVDITVSKLPADVTADPLTIPAGALEGTLTLRAKPTSVQGGPTMLDVSAVEDGPQGAGATTKVSAFVRGGRGALDTTFGDKGALIHLYGGEARAEEAKTLKDGSILVGARVQNNIVLSRFTSAGVLDPTFGGGGTAIISASQSFIAFDVVEPPSPAKGFIYVLEPSPFTPRIFRLNLDGTPDTSFNGNGQVSLDDGVGGASARLGVQIFALPDGKGLVSNTRTGGTTTTVTRWNADGTRDDTYGTGGSCQIAGGGRMMLRSSGAIFMTASAGMQGCTATGTLDLSIGVSPDYAAQGGVVNAIDMAKTPDGGVAFLGIKGSQQAPFVFWSRLTPTLVKDASIGLLGDVGTPLVTSSSFVMQDDGGVLIGGAADAQFKVLRYTSKGVLETAFGTDGTASFTISDAANLSKLVAQPDGRILALGKSDGTGFDAAMVRFWP